VLDSPDHDKMFLRIECAPRPRLAPALPRRPASSSPLCSPNGARCSAAPSDAAPSDAAPAPVGHVTGERARRHAEGGACMPSDEPTEPLAEATARKYFADLIAGLEYMTPPPPPPSY